MASDFRLRLKFWGVRGSTPTPQIDNLGFGGNTSCLEVRLPNDELLIFDGGTGLRNLGLSLLKEPVRGQFRARLFLTHFHWDHIQGIPFFVPIYNPESHLTFHSFHSATGLEQMLKGQMAHPYFPVPFDVLPGQTSFREVARDPIQYQDVTVQPFRMNHPQGAVGYRIERAGAVIVYASDLEHGHETLDKVVREYAQDADILIYDAQYTPEEYPNHVGWGHSTWEVATKVAIETGVKQLILFHHDPGHNDEALKVIVEDAREKFEKTDAAREGAVYDL